MATIGTNYDPASTAQALAENYMSARQTVLTTQTQRAGATASALMKLKSAISAYQSSLLALSSNKTILTQSATFSSSGLGTASASSTATPGTYSFFVEKLATANQVSYAGLADSPAAGSGTLAIELGGLPGFTVNMAAADTDGDTILTPREVAAAINSAPGNTAKVSASIVTIGGSAQLMLTARTTGVASNITLNTAALANPALVAAFAPANAKQVVAGTDARVWLGAQGTGTPINQASNTFTNVDGVSMTFTKAQAPGDTPVTLTVAADNGSTTANVQKFVDDYNKLKAVIDGMSDPGDAAKGEASGIFATDGGIRVLKGRLVSLLRGGAAGADSLAAYGIIAARDGTLSLDSSRLTKQLALNPTGLDALIGSASSSAPSGIAGALDTYLKQWSSSSNGQVSQRQAVNDRLQTTLASRQQQLDKQYDSAYKRYLTQFSQLQALQSQMSSNTGMFDALFGDKSK
jgi:flagellar hook-associated protein 2